jgi:hypothetical protein
MGGAFSLLVDESYVGGGWLNQWFNDRQAKENSPLLPGYHSSVVRDLYFLSLSNPPA